MSTLKKVMFLCPPEQGHVNPMCCLASELVKKNIKVIFYGNLKSREIIEKTGSDFRLFTHRTFEDIDHSQVLKENNVMIFNLLNVQMSASYKLLPDLLKDVEHEKPDLIIYDPIFLPSKYLIEIIKVRKDIKHKPQFALFVSSFVMNDELMQHLPQVKQKSLKLIILMFYLFLRQMIFNLYWGIRFMHPIQAFAKNDDNNNIVAIYPELQPLRDQFGSQYTYVGPCISEQVRNYEVSDPRMIEIMEQLKPDNDKPPNEKLKLVYFSLGTSFNAVEPAFDAVIESFRRFDEKKDRKIKLNDLKVVVSLGDKLYDKFQTRIKNEGFKVPDNVLLFRKVPQIEILKRASLFITHCGMNSTSETIKYGVPIISIPIVIDQPILADILCNQKKLGKSFNWRNIDVIEMADAVEEVLTDSSYKERMVELSKATRHYNGLSSGAQMVVGLLEKKTGDKKSS